MVGLSEEGPPKVDTEEVKNIITKFQQFFKFDYDRPNLCLIEEWSLFFVR